MRYECPFHVDRKTAINLNNLISGNNGCPYCRGAGENNPNWKGGVSELNQYLRSKIWEWKSETLESRICWVSGSTENLQIHHTYPYYKIRDEAVELAGLALRKTIGEYDVTELARLVKEFRTIHEKYQGVLLNADVHALFHSVYRFDVSMADLYEFKGRYLTGEFDSIRSAM